MYAGTLYDAGAPTIEVRIYREHQLLVRESCGSREEAAAIAEQASARDHVFLLVHDAAPDRGPSDVITREKHGPHDEVGQPLASQQLPTYGTE
jgi:hypothetical protein